MKKNNRLSILSFLVISAILFSCKTASLPSDIISSSKDHDKNYIWLEERDISGVKNLSIISDVEGYRIVCSNNERNIDDRLFIIESEGEDIPFDIELSINGENLILKLKNYQSSAIETEEKSIKLLVAKDLDVRSFENKTKSSSTDLRLTGIDIDCIDINTSSGSSYVELNNCTANRISINSYYGRSYIVMNQSEINSEILLTGTPDVSKVLYYDEISGAVHIEMKDCMMNCPFNINSVTGKIEVYADDTVFSGPIKSISARGLHYFDLWDCVIKTDTPVEAFSDSGKIYFKFAQHYTHGSDFEVNLNTGSEEIYLRIWGPLDLYRYDITTKTETGKKEFHSYEDFDTIKDGIQYKSKNYSAPLDLIKVRAETESGRIYTRVVNCYKELRFCGDYKNMRPLEPPF